MRNQLINQSNASETLHGYIYTKPNIPIIRAAFSSSDLSIDLQYAFLRFARLYLSMSVAFSSSISSMMACFKTSTRRLNSDMPKGHTTIAFIEKENEKNENENVKQEEHRVVWHKFIYWMNASSIKANVPRACYASPLPASFINALKNTRGGRGGGGGGDP